MGNQNEEGNQQNQQNDPPVDWHDKYDGQRKVNQDLERKLAEARRKADQVEDLQKQISEWEDKGKAWDESKTRQDATIASLNNLAVSATVQASATGRLVNPADALRFLDISDITVSEDGRIDTKTIDERIDTLVKEHPYLAQGGNNAGQTGIIPPSGTRDGDHETGQLKREDLKNMTPEQIEQARLKGRLSDLLSGKSK